MLRYALLYLVIISLIAIFLTISDKQRAIRGRWRVSEAALLTAAFLGGSLAMLLTMKRVRHKTQKKKFMIGIPLILFCQIILVVFLFWRFHPVW